MERRFEGRIFVRDAHHILVGGQADEGATDEELKREQEAEDREREAFIGAWKAMYRRKGVDPDTYRINWDAVFEKDLP